MKLKISVFFILLSFNLIAQNSVLSDKETLQEVEYGLDSIYNFQFDHVDEAYRDLKRKYPDHPLPPLFNALSIYWQHFPVTPNGPYNDLYVNNITDAINKSEALLEKDKNNVEAIFLNLMSRLLIMQYYADNDQSSKVIPHVRKAYKMVKKGFDLSDQLQDFLFSTGLYNYYREAYPEKHPVYKPIAYFFPDGNRKLGIKQLEDNWHNGIFLDAESLSFLVYISLNFESNYKKSDKYTKELNSSYPNNPLYLSYRIRTLLLLKKYNKALPLIQELNTNYSSNDFFQIMVYLYQGIYEEKKNQDFGKAEKLYWKAIKSLEKYQPFADSRVSYAYFGLSRIWEKKDHDKAVTYRNKALDLSSYSHINFD